jgi:phosphoadenosine phosphosulfate reductase
MIDTRTPASTRNDRDDIDSLAREFELRPPEALLEWAIERFDRNLAITTSFQATGMVILDMAVKLDQSVRVVTIDTGRMHPETYALIDQVRERYGVAIEVVYPDAAELEGFTARNGVNAFYRSISARMTCCDIRKVNPLKRALKGFDAWVTGQRRSESSSRSSVGLLQIDDLHGGIVKLNPLANWSSEQVWEYVAAHDVPTNALYGQGYTSIGCAPCTRPTQPGEDPRAGRWWWEEGLPKECGIHVNLMHPGVNGDAGSLAAGGL